jgi:Glycosyl-transferase for dystroglycan
VTQYQSAYEPYVIVRKDAAGWCVFKKYCFGSCNSCTFGDRCDERFTGYGGNKAACLFEMYLSGVSFYVLSDHFLIHQSHAYEEEARKSEVSTLPSRQLVNTYVSINKRRHNRKIHSDFKEEACLRSVRYF